jgi:8-hydroxy-5-deazaflavin:NADPH oxidoreductase
MKERIGVLGSGDVAKALAKGLKKHGKEVRIGSRSAEKLAQFAADAGIPTGTFADVAAAADIVILAVKGTAAEEAPCALPAPNISTARSSSIRPTRLRTRRRWTVSCSFSRVPATR